MGQYFLRQNSSGVTSSGEKIQKDMQQLGDAGTFKEYQHHKYPPHGPQG